jgi:hypothetical protein
MVSAGPTIARSVGAGRWRLDVSIEDSRQPLPRRICRRVDC